MLMKQTRIKALSVAEAEMVYETYMKQDFPPEELKPFASIARMMEQGIYQAMGYYEDGELCAYSLYVLSKEDEYCLLDYFAVAKEKRGNGVGHRYFTAIKNYLPKHFMNVKGIFIECETLRKVSNCAVRTKRERRIAFYLDNKAQRTALASELFGVEYDILLMPVVEKYYNNQSNEDIISAESVLNRITLDAHEIKEQVDSIYKRMFQKKHYDTCVKLWIAV